MIYFNSLQKDASIVLIDLFCWSFSTNSKMGYLLVNSVADITWNA